MKVKLVFDLPEERIEAKHAQRGRDYVLVLWDMLRFLRTTLKHTDLTDEQEVVVKKIRDKFHELLEDRSINLYED